MTWKEIIYYFYKLEGKGYFSKERRNHIIKIKVAEHTWMHMFSLAHLFVKKINEYNTFVSHPSLYCLIRTKYCKYTFDWQVNKRPPPPPLPLFPKYPPEMKKKKKQKNKTKEISKFLVYELKRDTASIHNRHSNGNLYFQGEARGEKQYKNRGNTSWEQKNAKKVGRYFSSH